ncbi:hypothetical protein FE633_11215 [Streptomyces montanus]|uniref:Uncharacterized protein n=1 Tax=Streptomyces montanus TaxID=2580423 RepID=A0A5R9FVW1_9ACTN|nr:hypothetical protein [Streptomyces montanus]TLS46106.1 hypothetical protein FE633_11215 [Streptomyces montanus]
MDRENEFDRQFRPDIVRVAPDRNVQLMKLRREQMERRLEALRVRGRVPRVVLYARTVNGQSADRSLAAAREFAERLGWQVGRDQTFTDCLSLTVPEDRYGWLQIRQHVKSGFADGVVALTRAAQPTFRRVRDRTELVRHAQRFHRPGARRERGAAVSPPTSRRGPAPWEASR